MDIIGVSVPRIDGVDKVTGRAAYVGDLEVSGMLHGKILRSPLPHAVITGIDTSEALKLPGVAAVLTRADLDGLDPFYGAVVRDRPFIATDKVRYQGEPVAAVAAVDLATAEEALDLIQIEYEELPVVSDTVAALTGAGATVHDTNLCNESGYEWGDVDDAFAKADHVFEDTFTFPMVYHYAMEPHAVIADYSSQGIIVWSTAQHPFLVREDLARMFGVQLQQVRVVVPYLGGGYGSKSYTKLEPLVVALSKVAGRPVRVALTVEEAFKTIRRHSARCTVKTGVMNDGTFVARECLIHLDTGAYADNGPLVANRAAERVMGGYRWDNVKIKSYAVYTNSTPAGSFRSIGAPQAAWASESQVDIIADALGLDPLEIRLKNLAAKGEEFRPGRRPLDADPAAGLRMAAQAIGMNLDREPEDQESELPIKTGRGIGCNLSGANLHRHRPPARGRHGHGLRRHHRDWARLSRRLGPNCLSRTPGALGPGGHGLLRHRHRALRPLYRLQPFHHHDGSGGAGRGQGSERTVAGIGCVALRLFRGRTVGKRRTGTAGHGVSHLRRTYRRRVRRTGRGTPGPGVCHSPHE